jgi:hypothetical protein
MTSESIFLACGSSVMNIQFGGILHVPKPNEAEQVAETWCLEPRAQPSFTLEIVRDFFAQNLRRSARSRIISLFVHLLEIVRAVLSANKQL